MERVGEPAWAINTAVRDRFKEEDTEAAEALGLRPLSPEEYRSRMREAEAMAGALTLVMVDESNAYEYRTNTWFRC